MLPAEGRCVVVLCGPPGSGKTTAAHESGLDVYDSDDPRWSDERTFRAAIARLATQPDARAVVIRSGATSTARAKACTLIGASHIWLVTATPDELARRIAHRGRADDRNCLAGIKPWFARHDRDDLIETFPGWASVRSEPNVPPSTANTPRPAARPARTASRTGRRWREQIVPRVVRRDGGICHLCSKPGADTADHLVPVALGGAIYSMANLAAAHVQCNRIRGTRPIDVVRAELTDQTTTVATWSW